MNNHILSGNCHFATKRHLRYLSWELTLESNFQVMPQIFDWISDLKYSIYLPQCRCNCRCLDDWSRLSSTICFILLHTFSRSSCWKQPESLTLQALCLLIGMVLPGCWVVHYVLAWSEQLSFAFTENGSILVSSDYTKSTQKRPFRSNILLASLTLSSVTPSVSYLDS